jgi:hypothetical protein
MGMALTAWTYDSRLEIGGSVAGRVIVVIGSKILLQEKFSTLPLGVLKR